MQAGILGEVQGDFEDPQSFHQTHHQDGTTFTRSFQIRQNDHLESGIPVYQGEAAIEVVDESQTVQIDEESGNISVTSAPERRGKYTRFIIIPDNIMVVASSDGDFAFDLLSEAVPSAGVLQSKLDLNSFAEDYYSADGVDPWQVGFFGNIGQAEKGIVYGEDVFNDSEMGDLLERSEVNQLGLEYEFRGETVKMTSARSGYVEVYNPSNWDYTEYAQYLSDEISKYTTTRI
ncbi:hypothetical protein [Halarchaeum sp. P4]|uniref:hypothetical protein n=1 Tax=Halarchaeum sp. P4 TaxID=3421639 RepID=UPI003EBE50BA